MKRYYTGRKSTALNRARQALVETDRPMTTDEILQWMEDKRYLYMPSAISLGQLLSRYHGFVQVGTHYKIQSAANQNISGHDVCVWALEEWDGEE
jgi:hypothetical protein